MSKFIEYADPDIGGVVRVIPRYATAFRTGFRDRVIYWDASLKLFYLDVISEVHPLPLYPTIWSDEAVEFFHRGSHFGLAEWDPTIRNYRRV